jgi:autotransporter strand-loop-strand O-heptosyltransferase
MKTKLLFLAPHLSSGGMPSFLLKRIQLLNNYFEIFVVEYECLSNIYVVHRNKIKQIVGDNFYTLDKNKLELINIINKNKIDIVHIEHESEGFDLNMISMLYDNDRSYRIIETCHNISFKPESKIFIPDGFAFCTPYHLETFKDIYTYKEVIQYPIENNVPDWKDKVFAMQELGFKEGKKNVLNVGLWTKGKNQGEAIEIARKNPNVDFHFVGNQAINFADYWKPLMENLPKNVKVWGERDDVDLFMIACDVFMFNSTFECNPLVLREAIGYQMPIYAHNLSQYCGMYDDYIFPVKDFGKEIKYSYFVVDETKKFIRESKQFYNLILKSKMKKQEKKSKYSFITHFVDGVHFEIVGNSHSNFRVQFSDTSGNILYEEIIKCNCWIKLNRKYYSDWNIKVWENDQLVHNENVMLKHKRVMISFESSSLGDTLAWMPYCDEFQKKHDCILYVSTFKNFLFTDKYPNINFIEPAEVVENLYAKYDLGWFYDFDKEPVLPNTIPLQQTATNILGLPFSEIKPLINISNKGFKIEGVVHRKHVCIATNSTAGCKEWTNENWQTIIDYLNNNGYSVVNMSLENNHSFKGLIEIKDFSIDNTIQIINSCEFFIGLSSGLSWLAWSLNKHVFMIANFSEANHEFTTDCTRIINESVCNSCWNNPNFKFDKGDWNWCPINKNLPKMFECQKSITAPMVIEAIAKHI